ncbi:VRR-NUC domain-containing protein [Vibrio sp. WXL210]|uniref:VRR-NUC domain-containing protein n=1 Tax=Vibrio sp. WXL210 TaxID=3450709 RepID=UPI003EC7C947
MTDALDLAPDYYLTNFLKLIEHATQLYSDLLNPHELDWIARFDQLDNHSRCLLVRMLSRKGEWFRSDKLIYSEIPNLAAVGYQLEQHGFITRYGTLSDVSAINQLLTKPEISQAYPELKRTLPKAALIELLPSNAAITLDDVVFYHLLDNEMIATLLALFFANSRQDLSQFVISDLGLQQFEHYPLTRSARYFSDRKQVEELKQLTEIAEQFYLLEDKQAAKLLALLESIPISRHPSLKRKAFRLINLLARDLERLEHYQSALDWFQLSQLPPARERQARILDKLEHVDAMAEVVQSMLDAPYNIEELEVAQRLETRVKRKRKQRVPRAPKPTLTEDKLSLDLSSQRVEYAALAYYQQQGWQVFYSENTLLNGLFGLAFWSCIFADVDNAFVNRYQHRPLDLYHGDFSDKRRALIEQTLQRVREGELTFILDNYHAKFGLANPFVQWKWLDFTLVELALTRIPAAILAELFSVILSDIKLYRNGMPDLILFNDTEFRWVEVKGPGDKLQDNQWRWIKHFQRLSLPFSVCWVSAQ